MKLKNMACNGKRPAGVFGSEKSKLKITSSETPALEKISNS
jgi:hypothetical protein